MVLKACFITHVPLGYCSQNSYCGLEQPVELAVSCTGVPPARGEPGFEVKDAVLQPV
jgi:hypothetical protein